jgi:recombination protein RecT
VSDRTTSQFQRAQQTEDTVKAVATVFDRDAGRYERLLPSHVSVDDFRNAFLTSVQRNPRLLEADRASFWLALQQAAGDGLKCDNRESALVIYSDTEEDDDGAQKSVARGGKPKQVVYMPMIKGLRKLLRNTGLVSTVEVELIFKGEVIQLWREDGKRHFKHVVNTEIDSNRSDANIIGAYAVVNFKDGTWQVEWMSRSDIEKVRAVSRAKSQRSPWQAWYSEMSKKTALRRLIKQLDTSPEIAALEKALDNDPSLGETIDGEATEIAEGIAARPTETRRPRAVQETSQTQQGQQTSSQADQAKAAANDKNTEDWRSEHGETTRDPNAGKQTTGSTTGNTTQQAKTDPKSEPKTEPARDTATKTAQSSPLTGITASTGFDPETGEITVETKSTNTSGTISDDGGFEAWMVDADEVETTPEPYSDAMQFASALTALCAGKSPDVVATILKLNDAAMTECRDFSAPAAKIIDAISLPKTTVVDEPARDEQRGQDQGSATNVKPVIEVLAIPQTPGGKPHWPNYAIAFKERLDRCNSAEEATAWMTKNKPVYFGKCTIATENQIQRHYDQTLARFSGQPSGTTASDADRVLANKLSAELTASTSLDSLRAMNLRPEVIDALTRWQTGRPELFSEIRTVGKARLMELQAEIG